MKEEKRKEILTRAIIRQELKRHLRKRLTLSVLLLLGLISLPIFCIVELRYGIWPEFRRPIYTWGMYIVGIITIPMAVAYVFHLFRGLKKDLFITTDTLISADYDEGGNAGPYCTWCFLRFAGYGEYAVGTLSGKPLHSWSSLYPLSAEGEYFYASPGDEYYLVLSKPHSGKILAAYNKKLFELVD